MADQDGLLVAEATALGIDIDGRWGDDTLRRKIGEKRKEREASGGEAAGDGAAAGAVSAAVGGAADHAGTANDGGASAGSADEAVGSAEAAAAGDGEAAAGGSAEAVDAGEGAAAGGGEPADLAPTDAGGAEAVGPAHPEGGAAGKPSGDDVVVAAGAAVTGGGDAGVREGVEEGAAQEGQAQRDAGDAPPADAGGGAGADAGQAQAPAPVSPEAAGGAADGRDGADVSGEHAAAEGAGDEAEAEAVTADAGDGSADGGFDVMALMTRPLAAALGAACSVFTAIDGEEVAPAFLDVDWLHPSSGEEAVIMAARLAAPFVRDFPDAPPAALYGHVRSDGGKHLTLPVLYEDLPVAERLAWIVFRDTLVAVDRELKAEQLRQAQGEPPAPRFVPIGETTLEEVDEPFATQAPGGDRIL